MTKSWAPSINPWPACTLEIVHQQPFTLWAAAKTNMKPANCTLIIKKGHFSSAKIFLMPCFVHTETKRCSLTTDLTQADASTAGKEGSINFHMFLFNICYTVMCKKINRSGIYKQLILQFEMKRNHPSQTQGQHANWPWLDDGFDPRTCLL